MKKIEAIIRKTKFEDVKKGLHNVGIDYLSFWDVRGVGKSVEERVYRGVTYDTSSIERTLVSFIVRDKYVDSCIVSIRENAFTGEVGDGRIFVYNVEDAYRIRTGDSGDRSLYDEE
ncbi:transcriptional regulator [Labilibaculum filiforme]|uniref:Transcriptional regulator n=1 Tax=Labilibaculum filiforme TaxID=1940526 RepID=A0A2N3I248_9BACT|nr:P-II family nitrogen regulator [Labilibaculum filiforme]PKQ64394.1 transcriptional regulator [Labilibaculum filiforme]